MKIIVMLLMLMPSMVHANSNIDSTCRSATTVQTIQLSKFGFSPASIFVAKDDRVCLIFEVIDNSGSKSIQIENYPIWATPANNKPDAVSFLARKVGSFKIKCGNGCSFANGTFKVVEKTEMKAMEDEVNKWQSVRGRQYHMGK